MCVYIDTITIAETYYWYGITVVTHETVMILLSLVLPSAIPVKSNINKIFGSINHPINEKPSCHINDQTKQRYPITLCISLIAFLQRTVSLLQSNGVCLKVFDKQLLQVENVLLALCRNVFQTQ